MSSATTPADTPDPFPELQVIERALAGLPPAPSIPRLDSDGSMPDQLRAYQVFVRQVAVAAGVPNEANLDRVLAALFARQEELVSTRHQNIDVLLDFADSVRQRVGLSQTDASAREILNALDYHLQMRQDIEDDLRAALQMALHQAGDPTRIAWLRRINKALALALASLAEDEDDGD